MDETVRLMRLQIEGRWSAHELGQVLLSVSDLYNLRLVLEVLKEDWHDLHEMWHEMLHFPPFRRRWMRRGGPIPPPFLFSAYPWTPGIPADSADLLRLARVVYPNEVLEVRRIRYESPGVTDIAGIGAIVGHIKDFILRIIEYCSQRPQRNLDNARREAEVTAMRIENAQKLVALASDLGYDRAEVRKLVGFVDTKQEVIIQVVDLAKLVGVSVLEGDDSSSAG
ncbi:MAG: hypothetical protein KatS3mg105_3009 [Gemmatales bacterium]|nr:MAG: hypothetical protein KatS3mg105_3009 [Gemmatales bacterium]